MSIVLTREKNCAVVTERKDCVVKVSSGWCKVKPREVNYVKFSEERRIGH